MSNERTDLDVLAERNPLPEGDVTVRVDPGQRMYLLRNAEFDSLIAAAKELRARIADKTKTDGPTVGSLFNQLDEWGAGSLCLSASDDNGKVLGVTLVAKDETAAALLEAYNAMDRES